MSNFKAGLLLFVVTFVALLMFFGIMTVFESGIAGTFTVALIASASLAALSCVALWIGLGLPILWKRANRWAEELVN